MLGLDRKPWRVLLTAALLASVLGIVGYLWSTQRARNHELSAQRRPAPAFTLTALDGAALKLDALRGHVVLIDFWATWCGPCRDEVPKLVELQRKYGPRGLQLLGISMDDEAEPVRAFYTEHRMNYPVALGDAHLGERFGGVLGMPAKFLVDRQGRIAGKHAGAVDFVMLEAELQELLSE